MVLVQTTLDGARLEVSQLNKVLGELQGNVNKTVILLNGVMGLMRMFTGDSEIASAITKIQRLITSLYMLWHTYNIVMAATGVGLPIAMISFIGGTAALANEVGSLG